jgi:hypothetical protein
MIRSIVRLSASVFAAACAFAASAQTPPSAAPPAAAAAPCAAAQKHQFDFWLGAWDVSDPAGKAVGDSRIEAILDGCVVLEHWRNAASTVAGRSFNLYNAGTGQWEQFWVDNGGSRLHLTGGLQGASMVLEGVQDRPNAGTGKPQRERITWTPAADGGVRQLWETSVDDGATWRVSFDGRYRRAKAGAERGVPR